MPPEMTDPVHSRQFLLDGLAKQIGLYNLPRRSSAVSMLSSKKEDSVRASDVGGERPRIQLKYYSSRIRDYKYLVFFVGSCIPS